MRNDVSAILMMRIQVMWSVARLPLIGRFRIGAVVSKVHAVERDLADLRCFAALLEAHRRWEVETGKFANLKALREWLWFHWQAPRRPQPLVRNKYPAHIPWSLAARKVIIDNTAGGLVIEHREPVGLVIRELLDQPPVNRSQLHDVLDSRLVCCVITKEEDTAITKAGYGTAKVLGADGDPWARYRAAGIDPDTFAHLPLG